VAPRPRRCCPGREALVELDGQCEALLASSVPNRTHHTVQDLPERERRGVEVEFAGLDLRKVEDVVDDAHEPVRRASDGGGELALLTVKVGVEEELVHPDHAVHRSPDLVTHVGEEP
jgi:hypothetical protein